MSMHLLWMTEDDLKMLPVILNFEDCVHSPIDTHSHAYMLYACTVLIYIVLITYICCCSFIYCLKKKKLICLHLFIFSSCVHLSFLTSHAPRGAHVTVRVPTAASIGAVESLTGQGWCRGAEQRNTNH